MDNFTHAGSPAAVSLPDTNPKGSPALPKAPKAPPPLPKEPVEPVHPDKPLSSPDKDVDIPEHPGPPLSDPEAPHG